MILTQIESTLPTGWHLSNLIALDFGWQVNIKDDEHVVVATGPTIESALGEAAYKAENHDYLGRLYMPRAFTESRIDLSGLLNLGRKAPMDFKRRI